MSVDIEHAILAINPDANFRCKPSNSTAGITWENGTTPISEEAILAKYAELKADFDALEWKRNRQAEYPDAIECVHALLDGGDTLTNLQAQRTTVKNKYPKGGN